MNPYEFEATLHDRRREPSRPEPAHRSRSRAVACFALKRLVAPTILSAVVTYAAASLYVICGGEFSAEGVYGFGIVSGFIVTTLYLGATT